MRLPLTSRLALTLMLAAVLAPPAQARRPVRAGRASLGAAKSPLQGAPRRASPWVALPAKAAPKPAPARPARDQEAPAPEERDPDRERILRLQEALTSVVHGPVLGRMRVGMRVIEAATGRTFFQRRGSALMDPASNQKVLATTTAIMRLGGDFHFRTELTGPAPDGEGVVHGDVVLRGSGDPSLRPADLESLAASVASRGITRIEGEVLTDARRIGSDESVPGERSPVRISGSALTVRVRPAATPGAAPEVIVRPVSEAFLVQNRATTRPSGRSRVTVALSTGGGRMTVTVAGRIAAGHPGLLFRRSPPNQRLYSAALLRGALLEAGVDVRAPADPAAKRAARAADDQQAGAGQPPLLVVHESAPLAVLIRRVNKDSDNEWADRLLEVVGAELYGGAATPAKGLRALREAMTELGLDPRSYLPTNGSGLGHGNRVTADVMAGLLQKLYSDPRWGPELMQSLSVGGVDGTTRNRFRGSPAAERVRAKTGTLRGKSCLSGLVGDGHEILVFSILVEGVRGRRLGTAAVRAAQVTAVNAMMRYARGALGAPPEEEADPGNDLEAGEDMPDSDEEEKPAEPLPHGQPASPATPPRSAPPATQTAPLPPAPPPTAPLRL
jgi:D-alanyl-D-alanine carboxypeptidase/D-alanyl-D-alanine-endopeptidase (penicillin-binding protein 4)